jgi:hypothetical protein
MVDLSRPGDYISVDLVIFDTPYCGKTFSLIPFACQDWALRIKISQIIYFSHVFPGIKTLALGESKT